VMVRPLVFSLLMLLITGAQATTGVVPFFALGDRFDPTDGAKFLELKISGEQLSLLKRFSVSVGDTLSLDWAVRFFDPSPVEDTVSALGIFIDEFGSPLLGITEFVNWSTQDGSFTEWQTASAVMPISGDFFFMLLIQHNGGIREGLPTAFLVDNIRLESSAAVPVPPALFLLFSGLFSVLLLNKKRIRI
jgi:hypothetical protein